MRGTVWAMGSLMMLAACGSNADPVGENSAGSIKTTAVGEVVGNIAAPTPTPTGDETDAAPNAADAATDATDDAVDAADNASTAH